MHKWRSAARTAAWYDQGDDSPNYNPFRKLNARRPILYRLEDDSGDGLQRITSEPDLTIPRADSFILPIHAGTLPERTHLIEYISAPSNVRTQSHIFRPTLEDSTAPLKVESADPQVTNIEGADVSPGGDEPEVQQLDFAITRARYRRRNIFEKVFRRNHGLLKKEHTHIGKKEHTHIGRKIGEIGKTIAAHGYPAADKTTVQTVQRNALVIDFEKDVDRAKGGNFYVTVMNKLTEPSIDSNATKTKGTGGPQLYPCSQAKTLFSGLALLHHPSTKSSDYALHLRVFHVQNDPQILEDIFSVFKLNSTEFDRYGTAFKQFALNTFTEHRSGKQTWFWRPSYDRSRNVLRLAFSLEYYTPRILESKVSTHAKGLDHDEDQDRSGSTAKGDANFTPEYAFYRKRLSIYIQHKRLKVSNHLHGSSVKAEDTISPAQIHDDHTETSSSMGRQHLQDAVSSENTILIVEKTLLDGSPIFQAEEQWKQLWSDSEIPLSPIGARDSTAALELLQAIVRFSFNKIVSDWRGYIKVMDSHISMLEEQIYDKPEDDSQAKELWRTSKQLLEMEKLLISQTFLIKVVQDNFISPAGPDTVDKDWLKDLLTDFEELRNDIQEDLIKAVTQMVDLMYKSVSIRDARKSVELNTSLWRLSWITFIFLPLTFLVGFFGMNVDTFHSNPSIKWYFITAVPFMCFILLLWFSIKYFMEKEAQKPFSINRQNYNLY